MPREKTRRDPSNVKRRQEIINSKITPTLTTLDWDVYRAIEASSEYGYPITQKDLCEAVGLDYEPDSRGNGNRTLWDIVKKINRSYEVDKVIYTTDYTYVLANETQFKKMMGRQADKLRKAGKDLECLKQKAAFNNQGKVLSNQLKPVSKEAKPFHEAYREN